MITRGDFIALKDAGGDYDLPVPGEADLAEIVHMSAAATGLVYETNARSGERLDERILKDAQGENTLPLLEFALERLFSEREVVDGETRLTFAAYEAMGGLGGAIDQAAEAALSTLGEKEIAALPRLLRSLAVPVRDKKTATVAGGELTVRTVPIADAIPDEAARALVDALIEARIIVATASERETDRVAQIGVAHQRVFESWKRARQIVEDHKDFFRIRDEVEAGRQRWQANGRPSALLLPRGVPLAEAEKIVSRYGDELTDELRGYVAQSGRRARRNQRVMRAVAAVFAALFVTATASGIFAYRNGQRAEANYGAAKETVDNLISAIAQWLGKVEGIRVATVDTVLGVVDGAIKKLQDASPGDPQVDRSRAAMLFQFAKTYQQTGSHAKAMARAEESLAIRVRLTNYDRLKTAPADFELVADDLRWELSLSLELMGDLYRAEARVHDARTCFEESLSIRRRLAAKSASNDDWAQGLSFLYVRIGDLDMDGDLAAAQMNYEKSLAIAAQFFRRNPEVIRWQRELSWGFQKIGDARMRRGDLEKKGRNLAAANGEFSAALDAYANNLCLRRRMAERTPHDSQFKRDVSYALDRIGAAKRELGDLSGTQDSYFEALAIRRALARNDPDDARYQDDVATSLQRIGDVYLDLSNPESALAFYEAALDMRLQLQFRVKEDRRAQQNVDTARKKVDATRDKLGERGQVEAFSGEWWRARVRAAEDAIARRQNPLAVDTTACWAAMMATTARIASPTYTAATK
jgi:eukaryotic-like serine/threonine-protein kinase